MSGNEIIEQPENQDEPEKKEAPREGTGLGYKKFEAKEHRLALLKAKSGHDPEGEEETKRLEAELAALDEKSDKKVMKPQALHDLDDSIKLREEDKKAPKKAAETLERQAFVKTLKALQENNKFLIKAEDQNHLFEFAGLHEDGKEVKAQETQKMLEHVDQGGDVPPNVEFHFHTSFKKDREKGEVVDVDYRLNIRQIMRGGLEATLSSLLSLSYAAAAHYDSQKGKEKKEENAPEEPKEQKETPKEAPLENLKKQLQALSLNVSAIQTPQWNALEVSLPEKQKQFVVVYDGAVFSLTEKRPDQTIEVGVLTPSEILQYIDKAKK